MSKLLEVNNLVQEFDLTSDFLDKIKFKKGKIILESSVVHAVNKISFDIEEGEVFSLVGESGCGKSTTARTIIKLLDPKSGTIKFCGEDITNYNARQMLALRSQIQMIFQDPYASLNPRHKVKYIIMEAMLFHNLVSSKKEAFEKTIKLLEKVGLSAEQANRYPHQFSGGQRQRIGIARALSMNPKLIIADEPVSALDVSIQAQILNILMDLKDEFGFSFLFIAHDLSVVSHISDSVGVMYLGHIVEKASKNQLFSNPMHPYTQALLAAAPTIDETNIIDSKGLIGEIPSSINLPTGCPFYSRCPVGIERCSIENPMQKEIEPGHIVACHLV